MNKLIAFVASAMLLGIAVQAVTYAVGRAAFYDFGRADAFLLTAILAATLAALCNFLGEPKAR